MLEVLLWLAVFALLFVAIAKAARAQSEVEELRQQLAAVSLAVADLRARAAMPQEATAPVIIAPPPFEPAPTHGTMAVPAPPQVAEPEPSVPLMTETVMADPAEGAIETVAGMAQGPLPSDPSFEQTFATRWLVWLGGVTIALAGIFLAKYAVEAGLLGPAARMILATLAGSAMIGAGEWLRRRPMARAVVRLRPDQVPLALTAAGLAVIFAAIYASFALHSLIGPGVAFALLAALCGGALALAFPQGPFVGLLGVAAGMLLPLLIPSEDPSLGGLVGWVLVLYAATLAVAWRIGTPWLLFVAVGGYALWGFLLMLVVPGAPLKAWWALLHLLGGPGLLLAMRQLEWPDRMPLQAAQAIAAVLACCFALAMAPSYMGSPARWIAVVLTYMISVHLSRDDYSREWLALVGAALALLAELFYVDSLPPGGMDIYGFIALTGICLLHLGVGAAAATNPAGGRPLLMTAAGAAPAITLLTFAMFRMREGSGGMDPLLSLALVVIGAVALFLTRSVYRQLLEEHIEGEELGRTVSPFAFLTMLAAALLAWIWLSGPLLTLVLAGLVVVAAIWGRSDPLPGLRWATGALCSCVLLRFLVNPAALDYALVPPVHWPLWAMGGAAALIFAAARLSAGTVRDKVGQGMEATAFTLLMVGLTLELKAWTDGTLRGDSMDLFETSLRSLVWLGGAVAVAYRGEFLGSRRAALVWSGLLIVLATGQIIMVQVLWANPAFTWHPAAGWALAVQLTLAYLLPVPLLLAGARRPPLPAFRPAMELVALLLLSLYLPLVTKVMIDDTIQDPWLDLLETGLRGVIWFALAVVVKRWGGRFLAHQTVEVAAKFLLSLSVVHAVVVTGILCNPVTPFVYPWGPAPVIVQLLLCYLAPAVLLLLVPGRGRATRFLSFLSFIAFVTMVIRHVFHGEEMARVAGLPAAELYTYSGAGIVTAAVLLVTGLVRRQADLRLAGLGLLLVTVVKVFLWDMESLEGVLRILSFLGLGLSLIAVGALYRKTMPGLPHEVRA